MPLLMIEEKALEEKSDPRRQVFDFIVALVQFALHSQLVLASGNQFA